MRVLDEQRVPQEKEITIGLNDGTRTEVKSGLKEGEQVIVSEADASQATSANMGGPGRRPPM